MTRRRIRTPTTIEAEILVQSRRRCCICFGLDRDDGIKLGQVAHLDKDPSNYDPDNLAFFCFNHHDQYDSRTSQSKNFTIEEIKKYREELYLHFGNWGIKKSHQFLLNFLASSIDLETIVAQAIKVPPVFYNEILAYEVLVRKEFSSIDGDLYMPYLTTLDYYASWGLLTYKYEEEIDDQNIVTVRVDVNHESVCKDLTKLIKKRVIEKGNEKDIKWINDIEKRKT